MLKHPPPQRNFFEFVFKSKGCMKEKRMYKGVYKGMYIRKHLSAHITKTLKLNLRKN